MRGEMRLVRLGRVQNKPLGIAHLSRSLGIKIGHFKQMSSKRVVFDKFLRVREGGLSETSDCARWAFSARRVAERGNPNSVRLGTSRREADQSSMHSFFAFEHRTSHRSALSDDSVTLLVLSSISIP